MNYKLKEVLKNLNVLFLTNKETLIPKETDILNLFFHKILLSHNANRAYKCFCKEHPDVVISDLNLEDSSGLNFCKNIREINPNIPIIILSELKSTEILFEIIRLQVIDFVQRPLKVESLIFALNQTAKHLIQHGNITIELSNNCIYDYKEKIILKGGNTKERLTKNEFKFLELLIANKNKTLNKKEIESHIWANEKITESAFKSLVTRLRNKIGKNAIKNRFGIGYKLA